MRFAVWRCLRGAPESASRTASIHAASSGPSARRALDLGSGAAGDMSAISAYLATVLRLSLSLLAISARGTPAASIARISLTSSRGTVISSILSGRVCPKPSPGKTIRRGPRPWFLGCGPHDQNAQFLMARCSNPGAHSDQFLLHINTAEFVAPGGQELRGAAAGGVPVGQLAQKCLERGRRIGSLALGAPAKDLVDGREVLRPGGALLRARDQQYQRGAAAPCRLRPVRGALPAPLGRAPWRWRPPPVPPLGNYLSRRV